MQILKKDILAIVC